MIKLDRSAIPVPNSLNSGNTRARLNELITNGSWINEKRYKIPYKKADVRAALILLSRCKCAFCEQILNIATSGILHQDDDFSREHFRPKSKYWWFAYSWDNLLPVCIVCNNEKDDVFDILGVFRAYEIADLANIHTLLDTYNAIEQPNYLHPEYGDDPESLLKFNAKGEIYATDAKAQNTILAYDLDRVNLRQLRKKIYDDFKEEVDLIQLSSKTELEKKAEIIALFRTFRADSMNMDKPFLAFRRFLMPNEIRDLIIS